MRNGIIILILIISGVRGTTVDGLFHYERLEDGEECPTLPDPVTLPCDPKEHCCYPNCTVIPDGVECRRLSECRYGICDGRSQTCNSHKVNNGKICKKCPRWKCTCSDGVCSAVTPVWYWVLGIILIIVILIGVCVCIPTGIYYCCCKRSRPSPPPEPPESPSKSAPPESPHESPQPLGASSIQQA